MPEDRFIGSCLKLAFENLEAVRAISPSHRTAPTLMFYSVENLLMAVLTSEGIDAGAARRKHGNHQVHRILDELPDSCIIKPKFEYVAELVPYAVGYRYPTTTGNLHDSPPENDANSYFEALLDMLDICAKGFQVDVKLDRPKAGSVSPIR